MRRSLLGTTVLTLVLAFVATAATAAPPQADVRFATFNASLNRGSAGLLTTHLSNPATPGDLRADHVLPRMSLQLVDAGVFWPQQSDPLFRLTGVFTPGVPGTWGLVGGFPTSDHRSVWIDVSVPSVD